MNIIITPRWELAGTVQWKCMVCNPMKYVAKYKYKTVQKTDLGNHLSAVPACKLTLTYIELLIS